MRDIAPPSFLGVVILSFEGFTEFLSPLQVSLKFDLQQDCGFNGHLGGEVRRNTASESRRGS